MISKLNELIKTVKNLPLNKHDSVLAQLLSMINVEAKDVDCCHHCGVVDKFVKYGVKNSKQRYKCKDCNKIFTAHTGTALSYSRSSDVEWREIIEDTLSGVSTRKTAKRLNISRYKVLRVRHLILNVIEIYTEKSDNKLDGEVEVDDTYLLESVKGMKIGKNYHRRARKHGAKSRKRGISHEYVSVNCAVSRDGNTYSKSVNTARPTIENVKNVFENRISENSIIFCDGDRSFINVFSDMTNIAVVDRERQEKYRHINTVNGFHSQLKGFINDRYHGVATKYLNKYCSMFSLIYKRSDKINEIVDFVFDLLSLNSNHYRIKINELSKFNILDLGQFHNLHD